MGAPFSALAEAGVCDEFDADVIAEACGAEAWRVCIDFVG